VSAEREASGYVIAATGLRAEARIAARAPRTRAVAGGGDAAHMESLIEQAIAEGCRGIVSFGMAGGLQRELKPGTCLIGREVVHGNNRYRADQAWAARLQTRLPRAELVAIAGVDHPLLTQSQKQALFSATSATAADMESHVAARVAARHALPLAVLRVVADPQARDLPRAALAGMRADGSTDTAAVLRSLCKDPGQIAQLVRVAADAGRAYWALLRCHRRLGPGLGLIDLG